MPDYQPIDYRLRCHTKRTDLPTDVLRDIGEAYEEIVRLQNIVSQHSLDKLVELDEELGLFDYIEKNDGRNS
jgi:hypothetical protein